jgi:hypothetical protein
MKAPQRSYLAQSAAVRLLAAMLGLGICPLTPARDLAGIPWPDFVAKSEFMFAGTLIRAESLGMTKPVRYTFQVNKVFKGPNLKEVTFDAPFEELREGIPVNRMGILALKRDRAAWILSMDERSWWPHKNEMKADYGGLPVYAIPTMLLHEFPKGLGENHRVQRLYEDGYRLKEEFVYPVQKVDQLLGEYLRKPKPAAANGDAPRAALNDPSKDVRQFARAAIQSIPKD